MSDVMSPNRTSRSSMTEAYGRFLWEGLVGFVAGAYGIGPRYLADRSGTLRYDHLTFWQWFLPTSQARFTASGVASVPVASCWRNYESRSGGWSPFSPCRPSNRHRFHGQTPSISTSNEKLSTIRMATIIPSTPTLLTVGSTMMVRTMSPTMSTSRPRRIACPSCRRSRRYRSLGSPGCKIESAYLPSASAPRGP